MLLEAALALCLEQGCSEPAPADVPSAAVEGLARAAAERGPIRRHLEAAFPSKGPGLAAASPGPPPPPPAKRRRMSIGMILLGALVLYATLYLIAFSHGFDP